MCKKIGKPAKSIYAPEPRFALTQGFTAVEILVVLAIAALLAALSLPVIGRARTQGLVTRTRATIAAVEAALYLYETDHGDYPHYKGTAGELIRLLSSDTSSPRWPGPYLRFKEENIQDGQLIDPWGSPYRYQYPQQQHDSTPFIFFSGGPDRAPNTDRDIGNW